MSLLGSSQCAYEVQEAAPTILCHHPVVKQQGFKFLGGEQRTLPASRSHEYR